MTIFGERIEVSEETGWGFCDFYLLPTYSDLKDKDFNDFPKFKNLFSAMEKVYQISFVSNIELKTDTSVNIKCQTNTFPTNTETFSKNYLERWVSEGSITTEDKFYIERLVDAFNRFPWRAAYFISSIFIAFQKPYETWKIEFFIDFYNDAWNGPRNREDGVPRQSLIIVKYGLNVLVGFGQLVLAELNQFLGGL